MENTKQMKRSGTRKGEKGSVTLEALVILPVFIIAVMTMAFILRAVYVQEYIQHAITQAAEEIAGASYLYGVTGALTIQRDIEGAADRSVDKVRDTVMKSWELENWEPDSGTGGIGGAIGESGGGTGLESGVNEFVDFLAECLKGKVNGLIFGGYAKSVTGKYLMSGTPGYEFFIESKIKGLNVMGGYSGIDFSDSEFLFNGSEDVVVHVKYRLISPFGLIGFSRMEVTQRAHARAWLYGGDGVEYEEIKEEEFDIWSLPPLDRGTKLQSIFNANLPFSFPHLSSYSNGTATLIRSLDTTAKSYQSPNTLYNTISGYIKDIRDYEGQPKPWGSSGIVIPPDDIRERRLILVIPSNDIDARYSDVIDTCIREALNNGVYLQVERYGKKILDSEKAET